MNENKKIAIILGRGVEGCGVTKNAVEFVKFHKNAHVFAVADKKWPRHDSMKLTYTGFKCADASEVEKIISEINDNFDALLVYSVPSVKHSEMCVDNFVNMLGKIKLPKTMVQVDHNIISILRNAKLMDICNSMDRLLTHSVSGAFAKWCGENAIHTPLVSMGVGFNYDMHREQWWKPIDEQNDMHVKWIGRCALWKGPVEMINLHNDHLRQHGFITTLEGLEASVQSLIITHHDGGPHGERKNPRDVNECIRGARRKQALDLYGKEKPGDAPWLYPDYKNEECMERLSRCAFGADLYRLKKEYYGNNIEYCHAEVISSGTVPLFHRHFGDHIIHPKTGLPCTHGFSGTVWYDPDNQDHTAEQMIKLAGDRVMRDEWREASFEFWKGHSDSSVVNVDIRDKVLSATPGTGNRFAGVERFFS